MQFIIFPKQTDKISSTSTHKKETTVINRIFVCHIMNKESLIKTNDVTVRNVRKRKVKEKKGYLDQRKKHSLIYSSIWKNHDKIKNFGQPSSA